jgi:GntR family transcriptional regulator / MocR family aminotransferase
MRPFRLDHIFTRGVRAAPVRSPPWALPGRFGPDACGVAPGVRLGWLVLPTWLLERFLARTVPQVGSPMLNHATFSEYLRRGDYERHIRAMRGRYRRRRDAAVDALAALAAEITVTGIAAGLHLVAALPEHVPAQVVVDRCAVRRVRIEPLTSYRTDAAPMDTPSALVLGYGASSERRLRAGIEQLAATLGTG